MNALDESWCRYAQCQSKVARRKTLDDGAWGLEASLNWLLEHRGATDADVDRAARSRSRRERYRRCLLSAEGPPILPERSFVDAIEARRELRLIRGNVDDREASLLSAISVGAEPVEVAAEMGIPVGRLRVRLSRLRRRLRERLLTPAQAA